MPEHIPAVEAEDIDYESLGGGSLVSNLLAGAFAGIMVRNATHLDGWCYRGEFQLADILSRNIPSCIRSML